MESKKTGAGILMIDAKTGDILLGKRGFQSSEANTFAPFGGTFEVKDIHPKTTAMREFEEESGINVPYTISNNTFDVQNNQHLTFYTYLGVVDEKFLPDLSNESLGYGWFSIEHLPNNLLTGFKVMLDKKMPELRQAINSIKEKGAISKIEI